MNNTFQNLSPGKKIYLASDFHLGAPNHQSSIERERKVIAWLDSIKTDAEAVFLVGDIFDFWFEYKHVIPKGFIRFQGKLAELVDEGVKVIFFTGNHDMWMFEYFPKYLGIPVFRNPETFQMGDLKVLIGHGDGLGPGDHFYKFLKRIFRNSFFQRIFQWAHPNLGMSIAQGWSRKSRISNDEKEEPFLGEREWLLQYCKEAEARDHHDYYIFGHRHLPLDLEVSPNARYLNLGEWMNFFTYAEINGKSISLLEFEG